MERRICLKRCRRFGGLFVGVVAGLLLCLALTAQPPEAECRQTVKSLEEGGDPDMPDRATSGLTRSPGLTVWLPGEVRLLELQSRAQSVTKPVRVELWSECVRTRPIVGRLLKAWSSVASWRFAF